MAQANAKQPDPSDMAVADSRLREAVELADILQSLEGFADSRIKAVLHQVGNDGKHKFIRTLTLPVDMEALSTELREEYGGGDYTLKIMLDGKFKDNKAFSIATPKSNSFRSAPVIAQQTDTMALMLQLSNESRKDQMAMMQTMMTGMMGMMTAVVSATSGGRSPDPNATIGTLVTAMKDLQPAPAAPGLSMNDMLDMLTKMKELAGDGGGEDMSIMGLARSALPLFGQVLEAQRGQLAAAPPALPPPPGGPPLNGPSGMPMPSAVPDTPGHRIIALIRDDIVYLHGRGHDPELAADALFDVLQKQGVTPDGLMALIAEFQASQDWPSELAKHGIPLAGQADIEWLNAVISHLVTIYTSDSQPGEPGRGAGGSPANPGGNGAASPPG